MTPGEMATESLYEQGPYRVVLRRPQPDQEHVVLESPDVVHILPVLPDGTIVLVRQLRYGAGCEVLQAPAGCIEEGETPEAAARRELREELGYDAARMARVGTPGAFSSPGVVSERSTFFIAEGCVPVGAGEGIPTVELSADEALTLIAAPGIRTADVQNPDEVVGDVKTMLLLLLARSGGLI